MDSVTGWTTGRLLKVCICCLRSAACLAVSRFTGKLYTPVHEQTATVILTVCAIKKIPLRYPAREVVRGLQSAIS